MTGIHPVSPVCAQVLGKPEDFYLAIMDAFIAGYEFKYLPEP